jgi:hypothetical protein
VKGICLLLFISGSGLSERSKNRKEGERVMFKTNSTQIYFFLFLTLCLLYALTVAPCVMADTFRDDFEDGNLDGWRQEEPFANQPTLWKIVDGELECTRPSEGSTFLITGEADWKDYTIEYDVKLLKDLGPGDVDVVARYKSPAWTHMILVDIGDWGGDGLSIHYASLESLER